MIEEVLYGILICETVYIHVCVIVGVRIDICTCVCVYVWVCVFVYMRGRGKETRDGLENNNYQKSKLQLRYQHIKTSHSRVHLCSKFKMFK
jgi:hypothetical protein